MNSGHSSSWQGLAGKLIVAVIALEVLENAIPRLLTPLVVLALVAVILRLVWWYTQP